MRDLVRDVKSRTGALRHRASQFICISHCARKAHSLGGSLYVWFLIRNTIISNYRSFTRTKVFARYELNELVWFTVAERKTKTKKRSKSSSKFGDAFHSFLARRWSIVSHQMLCLDSLHFVRFFFAVSVDVYIEALDEHVAHSMLHYSQ